MRTAVDLLPKIARRICKTYSARELPVILFWRQLVCECFPAYGTLWRRNQKESRRHLKENFPRLRELLEREGIMAIKCNDTISDFRSHGAKPDVDDVADEEFYKRCIPVAHRPAFGIICFPAEAYEDHPFVVHTLRKRSEEAGTRVVNQANAIRTASTRELLSNDTTRDLGRVLTERVLPAIDAEAEPKLLPSK